MSWASAFEDQQQDMTTRPAARAPATIGEAFAAEFAGARLDTAAGVGRPLAEAWDAFRNRVGVTTGQSDVTAAARAAGFEIERDGVGAGIQALNRYVDTLPDEQRRALADVRDVHGIAVRSALKLDRDRAETASRAYGLSGVASTFIGGVAGQMTDPLNLLTLPLGAARGAGFTRMLLQEAAAGAAGQAAQEPFVQGGRAALGLEHGFGEAALNVGQAAIGNAGFAGTLRLAGMGLAAARGGRQGEVGRAFGREFADSVKRADWADPADFAAAAQFFERQDVFGRATFGPADARADFAHRAGVEDAAATLEAGRAADPLAPVRAVDPVASEPAGQPAANRVPARGLAPDTRAVPIDEAAQARLDQMVAETDATRPKPAPARAPGALLGDAVPGMAAHRVATADGASIDVAPIVVEARTLRTSADEGYDPALQPRNRDRAASQAQIAQIAGNLDPARLGVSAEADRGAPIIGGDGQVESGNGRLLAIRQAYAARGPQADAYRKMIADAGVDVTGFDEPVLVRQRRTDLSPEERQAFTVAANQASTLAFSAPERARADARAITPAALDRLRNTNDLAAAGNADFVREFLKGLPATEHGMVATPDGRLSAEGLMRVKNAVLARAYGDDAILGRVAESADDHVRSLSNALVAVAPEWARLRADVEAGRVRPDVDTTRQLVDAVNRTADLRARGGTLDAYLGQIDAFDPLPLETARWMELFVDPAGTRAASQERIATIIRTYAEESRKVSTEVGFDLGLPAVTIRDLQDTAARKAWADVIERSTQGDLLGGQSGLRARDGADRGGRRKSGDAGGGDQAGGAGAGGDRGRPADDAGGSTAADGADAGRLTDARILPADPAERDRTLRAADVERRLAETPDMLVHGADGTTTPAADVLKRAADEKTAADELADCLLKPAPGGDAGGAA